MRLPFLRALPALCILALPGCGGDDPATAEHASLPPLVHIDGDSAALAAGFVKLEPRPSPPRTVREAYLERSRRRWDAMPTDSLIERVPESLRAALDSAVAAELQAHADELRTRAGRTASVSRPASVVRDAADHGTLATLARPLAVFLPTTAWAAAAPGPAAQGRGEGEPVVHERTSVTLEGATVRTRRSLREFASNGRIGYELQVRATTELVAGGVTTRMTEELRDLVDVSYCPDAAGIAAGRREQSSKKEVDVRGSHPSSAAVGALAQIHEAETGIFSGQVDDRAELLTIDGDVEVSSRTVGKEHGRSSPAATAHGLGRGRFVGVALSGGDDSRRYVKLPEGLDAQEQERWRQSVESSMSQMWLGRVLQTYESAKLMWRSGECLEIRLVEEPDPSRLRLGERTTFVPEVRHRFDPRAASLPLTPKAEVGTVEGDGASGARVAYRSPGEDSDAAPRFREDGATVTLWSTSRRGLADTTLHIASAEPAPKRYRVTVTLRNESAKWGVGSEYTYEATLAPAAGAAEDELTGIGTYEGFLVARAANCVLAEKDAPDRFDVSGKLEASGGVVDMNPFGPSKPSIMFTLGTLDWPLKPLYGGDGPFATTDEEREAIKGLGSVVSGPPIQLTGPVTTVTRTSTSESKCAGTTTHTTTIRIERPR